MDFESMHVKRINGVLRYRPNITRWTARNRKDHIIGIQLAGSAFHTMKTKKFMISEGCAYFLNQRDDYQVEVFEPTEALSIHFTTYEEIDTESFCFSVQSTSQILSILQKAEICSTTGNELKLFSLLYELCDVYERMRAKPYMPKDDRMQGAKNYIDQHFTEADCLARAVADSGLGERRFRDLFRDRFDETPSRYVTLKKIALAQNLLSAGGVSVSEASERCGFSDVYYFSKVFKEICGIPPSKWK